MIRPTKIKSRGLMVQELKGKIYFQDSRNGGILQVLIDTILAFFDLQVDPLFPTKFRVNWPCSSEDEGQNRFSRWPPWQPFWTSDGNDFCYFCSTSCPNTSYQV